MNGPSKALSKSKQLLHTASQCVSLLRHYAENRSLSRIKQLHARTTTTGLLSHSNSLHLVSNFAAAYALCGCIPIARKLFDKLPEPGLFLYNAMIRMYMQKGLAVDTLHLFVEMLGKGRCQPDKFTYPFVIKACGDLFLLRLGRMVHERTVVCGFGLDTYVQNSLLAMYMNFEEDKDARRIFDTMCERTVVSWNTMINGYFRNGYAEKALVVFHWMTKEGVEPDCATVISVLPPCGYLKKIDLGKKIHALAEEKDLVKHIAVSNALVDMYAKSGAMKEASLLIDKMGSRDVITWTSMVNGYILNGDARSALALCWRMHFDGVRPNSVTIASLLSACADLHCTKEGQCLHGWAIRQKLESDVIVETALIDMYAKCNLIDLSFRVFAQTSKKRTVPWNAILSGCIYNGLARESIELFKQMLVEVEPNMATLNSLLPAYAILADLQQAMNIHCYLLRCGYISACEIATGLIDIYFKCGNVRSAHKIFNEIPKTCKDIIVWSVIIAGYGKHGQGEAAVSLFHEMVQSGVKPNEVTFTSVLHACSHAGLVDEGLNMFKFMVEDQKMCPLTDHYTCIVDLLGRAGRLPEAYNIICSMPFEPTHAVWGALLGACVMYENVELGELAARWLFEIEPKNTGNYVLLTKLYAAKGRWKDAENVRHLMNEIGLTKTPAHSLIEARST